MYGLHFVRTAFDRADDFSVLQYTHYYDVFEMLNVDKIAH